MNTKLSFLSLIFILAQLNAMEQVDNRLPLMTLLDIQEIDFIQRGIICNDGCKPLEKGQTINSMARVDKSLNKHFNTPHECYQYIKQLSHQLDRFHEIACSYEHAAFIMSTQASQERFNMQNKFRQLFESDTCFNEKKTLLEKFYLMNQLHIDLNFTYSHIPYDIIDTEGTILHMAVARGGCCEQGHIDDIIDLVNTKMIDINIMCACFGKTALMLICEDQTVQINRTKIIQLLCAQEQLKINQQDHNGNSALMVYCKNVQLPKIEELQILLDAGSNTELTNHAGETALFLLDEETQAYEYLQNVIFKKHSTNKGGRGN